MECWYKGCTEGKTQLAQHLAKERKTEWSYQPPTVTEKTYQCLLGNNIDKIWYEIIL